MDKLTLAHIKKRIGKPADKYHLGVSCWYFDDPDGDEDRPATINHVDLGRGPLVWLQLIGSCGCPSTIPLTTPADLEAALHLLGQPTALAQFASFAVPRPTNLEETHCD